MGVIRALHKTAQKLYRGFETQNVLGHRRDLSKPRILTTLLSPIIYNLQNKSTDSILQIPHTHRVGAAWSSEHRMAQIIEKADW